MLKFSEELLQFIWRYKLLKPIPLITRNGHEIFILKPGELNVDAGPDFFNARIRINGIVLVGNVEIHIRTSDWLKHNHQKNRSYDTIILHAVYEHDINLVQNTDNNVEVLELKNFIDERTLNIYDHLATTKEKLPCAGQLRNVDDFKFNSWIERMTIERLEVKLKHFENFFEAYNGDYTQTFYTILTRNFGFKVNALAFELIAKNLPIHLLLKHSDNLMQLEALLLGMSGLLENQFEDRYVQNLQNEFVYLRNKYQLVPLEKTIFKFSKLRPANFPNVRLAQLAMLIHTNTALFTDPQNHASYAELMKRLKITQDGYWKNHYKIGGKLSDKDLTFGEASAENLIINTFAPFFFFYSKKLAKPGFTNLAIDLLNECAMEHNIKTKLFLPKKNVLSNAAASQGVINLYDNYCSSKKCLQCGIAASILKSA
jgi:hypothetical protein